MVNVWDREIAATADALGCLLNPHPRPGRLDLDVAITARAAVLGCVGTVLGDIAPRTREPFNGRRLEALALVETDPLRALGASLRNRPRLELSRSPSELLDNTASTRGVTAGWATAGRHALLASRAWWAGAPHVLPADQAWQVVGEVAALAEAVGQLDGELATHLDGRADIARVLKAAKGLRLAAGETASLAARGDNASGGRTSSSRAARSNPRPARAKRSAITTSAAEPNLAAQARRLTALLAGADHLMPGQIRSATNLARDLTVLAAKHTAGPGAEDRRSQLGVLAHHLHAAASTNQGEEALAPASHPRLNLAVHELRHGAHAALGTAQDPDTITRLTRSIPPLVDVLARQTHAQVVDQRWAMPNRAEGMTLPYAFVSTTDPALSSTLLTELERATAAASQVRGLLAPPSPMPARAEAIATLRVDTGRHQDSVPRYRHPIDPPPAVRPLQR